MQAHQRAAKAYQVATTHRSWREQEADVFRRTSGVLRQASEGKRTDQARALADNRLLWIAVRDLLGDPANKLPDHLRASMISLSVNVQREMAAEAPNFEFLAYVNDQLAAGLTDTPVARTP